jgi:FkbM family methyltransferase
MTNNKILLQFFIFTKKIFGGKGLSKYSLIKKWKYYGLNNFRAEYTNVQGSLMHLDKFDESDLSINGIYEPLETEIIKEKIQNGDVVIDIGANIGYFTLLLAKLVGTTGKVFAFEPEPSNFSLLNENIKLNKYNNVITEQKGVADSNNVMKFFLANDRTMHSLHKSKYHHNEMMIDVVKLDDYFKDLDFITKIKFIKIDAEGSEFNVLKGMKEILKRNNTVKLLIEFIPEHLIKAGIDPKEVIEFLRKRNFEIFFVNEKTKKMESISENFVFSNVQKDRFGKNIFCVPKK